MLTGTVKWFNPDKGDEDGGDLFVHHRSVSDRGGYRTLEESQRARFDVSQGPRGGQATNVETLAGGG
jgi:cold shock CspA family protein